MIFNRVKVRVQIAIFQIVMFPLPLIPSHQGRGKQTFCEVAKYVASKLC